MDKLTRIAVAPPMIARHPRMKAEFISAYPSAVLYEGRHYMGEDALIEFLKDCDAAVIGFEPVTERVLVALPQLKVISKYGAGCETIDFHALKRHGVRFGYTWGVNKLAVAELTLCFMIAAQRWIMPLNLSMRAGERPDLSKRSPAHRPHGGPSRLRQYREGSCAHVAAVWLQDPGLRSSGLFGFLCTPQRNGCFVRRIAGSLGSAVASSAKNEANAWPIRQQGDRTTAARLRADQHMPRRHRR